MLCVCSLNFFYFTSMEFIYKICLFIVGPNITLLDAQPRFEYAVGRVRSYLVSGFTEAKQGCCIGWRFNKHNCILCKKYRRFLAEVLASLKFRPKLYMDAKLWECRMRKFMCTIEIYLVKKENINLLIYSYSYEGNRLIKHIQLKSSSHTQQIAISDWLTIGWFLNWPDTNGLQLEICLNALELITLIIWAQNL